MGKWASSAGSEMGGVGGCLVPRELRVDFQGAMVYVFINVSSLPPLCFRAAWSAPFQSNIEASFADRATRTVV